MNIYTGVVENINDPLRLGRCQVRVVGLMTDNKTLLPTEDLPWAIPMQPITSAAMNGIGWSPTGIVCGTWVLVVFRDSEMQQPIMLGTLGGIPQEERKIHAEEDSVTLFTPQGGGSTSTTDPNTSPTNSTGQPIIPPDEQIESFEMEEFIGVLTENDYVIFRENIGEIESTNNYTSINKFGYVGKYQFGADVLKDLGYLKSKISNKQLPTTDQWTGKNNCTSLTVLLNTPTLQDKIMLELTQLNYKRLKNNYNVITSNMSKSEVSGWLSACHNQGPGACIKLSKQNLDSTDGFGTSARAYYQLGYKLFSDGSTGPQDLSKEAVNKPDAVGETNSNGRVSTGVAPEREIHQEAIGYYDPNLKYPIFEFLNEPDTNRLARGIDTKTIVEIKDNRIVKGVPIAFDSSWSQPRIPYNARYPFNQVYQSECGHVMEFDSTPDNERIHLYHKTGTYSEIDCNGTKVDYIVGDNYTIISRNNNVYIKGRCNITIDGDCNLLVQSNANIEVAGDVTAKFKNDVDAEVSGSMSLNVTNGLTIKAGSINMESTGDLNIKSGGKINAQSSSKVSIKSAGISAIDGSRIDLNNNVADSAQGSGLGSPGAAETPLNPDVQNSTLETPVRNLEQEMVFEAEDENDADFGLADWLREKQNTGKISKNQPYTIEETAAPEKKNITESPENCSIIYGMSSFPRNFQLSKNFNFSEIVNPQHTLVDQYCRESSGKERLYKKQEIMCNLKNTCDNILEKILKVASKSEFLVTSSYRQRGILAKESKTTDHWKGKAVDIQLSGSKLNNISEHYDFIQDIQKVLPYDQLLLEYRNTSYGKIVWIHISYNMNGGRGQIMTLLDDKVFKQGFVKIG